MKKTLTTTITLATLAVSVCAELHTAFQFNDAAGTRLDVTNNSGSHTSTWNFPLGKPDQGLTNGSSFMIGKDLTAGSVNINKDYTRKVIFGSSVTSGTYTFEYRLSSWDFSNAAGDAKGNNQEGISIKLVGTKGNITLVSALNKTDSDVRIRHAPVNLGGTAKQHSIGITHSDLVVRITGDLEAGTYTTSISEQGGAFINIITDGTGLTDITEIVFTAKGSQAWSNDKIGIDYITLDVASAPNSSTAAILGLGGLTLILSPEKQL